MMVVGEETQLKLAEDRLTQSGLSSEVGLVIGKLNGKLERGLVFDLIPTPPNDSGQPASSLIHKDDTKKKGGTKPKSQTDSSSLSIDKDWVAEHARQVSRMLLGGMKVVGIYIWVNESSFKNSTIILCETVKGVAEAASLMETDLEAGLLIHISPSPRRLCLFRWTCRNCMLASNITSSSLRPCDFKMGRVLTSLQTFKCTYNFDIRLPICREKGSNIRRLADILRRGISSHAKELKGAKALVDGKLVIVDEQCVLDCSHEVEFLLPFMQDISVEECSQKEVVGVLFLSGSVSSFAYLNSKELISQALVDIKEDIIRSLQSRLNIICDEADRDSDMIADCGGEILTEKPVPELDLQLLRKQCSLSLPRRVFVPWLADTYICDYIQPSETLEVLKDHCVELMSMEAPTDASTILEPETEASISVNLTTKSFWDDTLPFSSESLPPPLKKSTFGTIPASDKKSTSTANLNIMVAILIIILSILVGLALHVFRAS